MSELEHKLEELSIGSMPFEVIKGEIFDETGSASNGLEVAISLLNGTKKQVTNFQAKVEEGLAPKDLEKHYKKLLLYFDVFDASINAIGSFSDNPILYRASDEQVNHILKEGIKYFRFNLNSETYRLPSEATDRFREATEFVDHRLQDLGLFVYKKERLLKDDVVEEIKNTGYKLEELHKILDPNYETEQEKTTAMEDALGELFVEPVDSNGDSGEVINQKEPETSITDEYTHVQDKPVNGNGAICLALESDPIPVPPPPLGMPIKKEAGKTDPLHRVPEPEAVPAEIYEKPEEASAKLYEEGSPAAAATEPGFQLPPPPIAAKVTEKPRRQRTKTRLEYTPPPPVPEHMKAKVPNGAVEPLDPSMLDEVVNDRTNEIPVTPAPISQPVDYSNHYFFGLIERVKYASRNFMEAPDCELGKKDTRAISLHILDGVTRLFKPIIKDYLDTREEKPTTHINNRIEIANLYAEALRHIKDKKELTNVVGYEITTEADGKYNVKAAENKPQLPNTGEQINLLLQALGYTHKDKRGIPMPKQFVEHYINDIDAIPGILMTAKNDFAQGDYRSGMKSLKEVCDVYRRMKDNSDQMDQNRNWGVIP